MKKLKILKEDYKKLNKEHTVKTFSFSKLHKEADVLNIKSTNLESKLDYCLNTLGNLKDDEARAKEQLKEIKILLKEAKTIIKEYKLPLIPNRFYIELEEATLSIKEVINELNKQPITISTLNIRVDTSRDLVLKFYNTTKELIKTAHMAEMSIMYGNRYRSDNDDIKQALNESEKLFSKGDYKKSLECSINILDTIENGFYNKLLELSK